MTSSIDSSHLIDRAYDADFVNIVQLAARHFNAESAVISFHDAGDGLPDVFFGTEPQESSVLVSFVAQVMRSTDAITVADIRLNPLFAANCGAPEASATRSCVGMRIEAVDKTPIASLCVFSASLSPETLTVDQNTILHLLAGQVRMLVDLHRSAFQHQTQIVAQSELTNELQQRAELDQLTGLPTRDLFKKCATAAMRKSKQSQTRVIMMLIDVDHIKQINDSFGHDAGDALLCEFTKRLRGRIRISDTLARLDGDEFGIVLSEVANDADIAGIIELLLEPLRTSMEYRGRQVDCGASVGLAVYPDQAKTFKDLSKCCNLALGSAKKTRGCVRNFSFDMNKEFDREAQMLALAREAVQHQLIVPFYQPKIDLRAGTVVGFEALARWERGGAAAILPEMFAYAFEHPTLGRFIGEQMLTKILDDVREWVDHGLVFGRVAINTGVADFSTDDFAERLLGEIKVRGLNPRLIEIEVTEGVFLGRGAHFVVRAISSLSGAGMRIALDDFGTGFASLTNLKELPIDVLKIDRSFVAGIGKNADDTAIVSAIIGLGSSLGLEIVAEGIETSAQATFVKNQGCVVGQGFLYGAAQSAVSVPAIITQFAQRATA